MSGRGQEIFFSHRVIGLGMPWMGRLFHPAAFNAFNAFKNRLNNIRVTRMGYFME